MKFPFADQRPAERAATESGAGGVGSVGNVGSVGGVANSAPLSHAERDALDALQGRIAAFNRVGSPPRLPEVRGRPVPHLWLTVFLPQKPGGFSATHGRMPIRSETPHLAVEIGMGYESGKQGSGGSAEISLRAMRSAAAVRGGLRITGRGRKSDSRARHSGIPLSAPIVREEDGHKVLVLRDLSLEEAYLARLFTCIASETAIPREHFTDPRWARTVVAEERGRDRLFAINLQSDENAWGVALVHRVVPLLEREGWRVRVKGDLPFRLLKVGGLSGRFEDLAEAAEVVGAPAVRGNDWFRYTLGASVGEREISLAPVLAQIIAAGGFAAWRADQGGSDWVLFQVAPGDYVRLEIARLEPLVATVADWLGDSARVQVEASGTNEAQVPQFLLPGFAASMAFGALQAAAPELARQAPARLGALAKTFENFARIQPVTLPASFTATLRGYQHEGLDWLQFLGANGLGGVLADDMGLGKTVQALAHIAKEHAAARMSGPVLIIAPTSLIFNWQAEAARHAPALKVLALTGKERARRFAEIRRHDVVLTTYALLPRDGEELVKTAWHAIVLDEAQNIKNARTKAAQWVREFKAGHRLALSGTPLENHLGELWSIMDFAVPGLFGDEKAFRQHFRNPIENLALADDPRERAIANERRAALQRRLKPFLLRRTKEEVAPELPAKTEIIRTVEMESEQRDLYETVRAAMDERVRKAIAEAGLAKSHIVVLDALLKLRQVCCDPRLVKLDSAAHVKQSAKLDLLLDMLPTMLEEGRSILLFSQFTSMLDVIEGALDGNFMLKTIPRVRLDGATDPDARRAAVERFQAGEAKLFLLSLKAGGVGLNLTAADTVIHYDPWWNPAVENQATDRAHRIGQDKPVFVYKLLTAGTVEEKIAAMQARKAELAAAVLTQDAGAFGQAVTADDLSALFGSLD